MALTDHRAMCSLSSSNRLNGRLKQLAMKLQPWMCTIQCTPGKYNMLAHTLSTQKCEGADGNRPEQRVPDNRGGARLSDVLGSPVVLFQCLGM